MKHTTKTALRIVSAALFLLMLVTVLPFASTAQETVALGDAGEQLDPNSQKLYLFFREFSEAVVTGDADCAYFGIDEETFDEWGLKHVWTNTELGLSELSDSHVPQVIQLFWEQLDVSAVIDALLHDCPYEMFWFDKTQGLAHNCAAQMTGEGGIYNAVHIDEVMFFFAVSPDYRVSTGYDPEEPMLNMQKVKAAYATLENAQEIVERHAELSDYEKLLAYCREICELTEYNHAAVAPAYTGGYGDPWQPIYVFDGDPNTNVVCEGYAKAFQTLCNLSTFRGNVKCYTILGMMSGATGAGEHMWNIVVIGGESYLVDVTNSDTGSVGQNGELFLAGYSEQDESGFTITVGSRDIHFSYDETTVAMWGAEEDSILNISNRSYEPTDIDLILPDALIYTGEALTVGAEDADILYTCKGGESLTEKYTWIFAWFDQSGNTPIAPPVDAGQYILKVEATNNTDPSDVSVKAFPITVEKAEPTYTSPTALTAPYGSALSAVALPEGFAWKTPTDTVGAVGTNSHAIVFTPADTKNYQTVELAVDVLVTKAIPTYTVPTALTASYGDQLADVLLPEGFAWQGDTDVRVGAVGEVSFSATYTPTDLDSYQTVADIEVKITVQRRDISDASVTLGDAVTYSGEEQEQTVAGVRVNGMGVTFTVSENRATEIGVYTLTVTGTGNFTGTKTVEWRITPDMEAFNAITLENVKSTDLATINALRESLAGQEADWRELLSKCTALLQRIDAIAAEAESALAEAKRFDATAVTSADRRALDAVAARLTALLEGENLTDAEKAPLREAQTNIDACIKQLNEGQTLIIILIACGAGVLLIAVIVITVVIKKKKARA